MCVNIYVYMSQNPHTLQGASATQIRAKTRPRVVVSCSNEGFNAVPLSTFPSLGNEFALPCTDTTTSLPESSQSTKCREH